MKIRPSVLPVLLAASLAAGIPRTASAAEPSVEITGTRVLPPEVAQNAAGQPPSATANLERWAARAVSRIVSAYKAKGYTFARAWSRVTPDSVVQIDVDEGRMSGMVFMGASPEQTILFRVDVAMPEDVFHLATVEKGLKEIKAKYRLVSVDWHVADREELIPNRLGQPIALRGLRIDVVRRDRHGWAVDASLDSSFGFVPAGSYRRASLLADDDRIGIRLAIGVPYRRYLFDAEPQFTWVHGQLSLNYRTRTFADDRLNFSYEATGTLSRYDRTDLGFNSYLAGRWSTYANLSVHVVRGLLSMTLGFGLGDTHVFGVRSVASTPQNPRLLPRDRTRLRYLLRVTTDLELDPEDRAPARKRNLHAQAVLVLPHTGRAMLDLSLGGQYIFSFGYHDLLLKLRGVYMLGEVLFWDDQTLAGECQRVFFGNRYWIREAAQLEVAARLGVYRDKIKLGLFHDLSVFVDRTRAHNPTAVANGFGPSVHFLIFDQFTLDLYYGFGFAPSGFGHNFSLALQSTF